MTERLSMFTRASNGDLVLAGYTGRRSYCWIWAIYLSHRQPPRFHIAPKSERKGQWHHMIPLLFGWTLIISRQDYHRDPWHRITKGTSHG